MGKCNICNSDCSSTERNNDTLSLRCARCGRYKITFEASTNFENSNPTPRQIANISGWLSENQNFEITTDNLDKLLAIPIPSFHERADKLLLRFEKYTEYVGQLLKKDDVCGCWGWCIKTSTHNESDEILKYLVSSKRIDQIYDNCKITPEGWAHLEAIKRRGADSQQGFVAMWFDDGMMRIYTELISKSIINAGYKPHRVDQREHNGKIDDEIIAQIRRSRFVVADFTGHRGGVYYEAGFAQGLGLEVFWTCRKDDFDNLHFDVRQYNCIPWDLNNPDDFVKKLSNRIECVLGRGVAYNRT